MSIGVFRYQQAVTALNQAKDENHEIDLIEARELEVERLIVYPQKLNIEGPLTLEDVLNKIKLFVENYINDNYEEQKAIKVARTLGDKLTDDNIQLFPNSAYLYAAYKGNVKIVTYLLTHGAELGGKDKVSLIPTYFTY